MKSLHGHLLALAGVSDLPSSFLIEHDGEPIEASVQTDNEDDPVGMTLWLNYDRVASRLDIDGYRGASALRVVRPMRIHLRTERAGDRAAVAQGLSAEWQSGDADFDRAVYVDSPTQDAHTLSAVLGAATRAAVLRLRGAGAESVDLDDEQGRVAVHCSTGAFVGSERAAEHAMELLDALVALSRALPRVEHSGGAHAPAPLAGWTKALGWIGALGWSLNVALVGVLALGYEQLSSSPPPHLPFVAFMAPLLSSIVGAIGCARAYSAHVGRRMRGRSNAHTTASTAFVSAFGGFSVLLFILLFAISLLYLAS